MDDASGIWIWQAVFWAASLLLWVIPMWMVLKRTGKIPAIALVGFVPLVGPLVVLFVIAYGRWPHFEIQAER
jgi:hypothetical protein